MDKNFLAGVQSIVDRRHAEGAAGTDADSYAALRGGLELIAEYRTAPFINGWLERQATELIDVMEAVVETKAAILDGAVLPRSEAVLMTAFVRCLGEVYDEYLLPRR